MTFLSKTLSSYDEELIRRDREYMAAHVNYKRNPTEANRQKMDEAATAVNEIEWQCICQGGFGLNLSCPLHGVKP